MAADRGSDDARLLRLAPGDNVAVLRAHVAAGEALRIAGRRHVVDIAAGPGHKIAVRPIGKGERVLKYGAPIGSAMRDISPGQYVHIHNVRSDYIPTYTLGPEGAFLDGEGGRG